MLQARGSGLPDAEKSDGQRVQMLTYQNNKLSAQLEVQRKEIAALEAKVSQMDNKQIDYEQTLSCVDRLWTQLNDDIQFLAKRTAIDSDNSDGPSSSGQDHLTSNGNSPGDGVEDVTDPFLQRLVRSHSTAFKAVAAKSKELAEDATEAETALLRRSEATKACLARLLDLQRQQEQRVVELASSLGKDAGAALQDEVNRALSEATAARRELDAQKAINRALSEQQCTLDDQRMKDEVTIRDLTNELADKSEQVAATQRKLVLARTNSFADGPQLPSSLAKPEVKQEASASQPGDNNAGATQDAEENRKLLDKREAELDAEKESNMKLQREVRDLQESIARGSFVPESQLYQQAQREVQAAREDMERQRLLINTLQQERAGFQSRQQSQELQVKQGEYAMRMLAIATKREQDLEKELQRARAAADDADLKLQTERHRMGQNRTMSELQQHVEALQKEKKVLQSNMALHKAAAERTEEARKEAQSLLSALKAKEIEVEHLQKRIADFDRIIAEAHASEEEAKVKAQDMQVFVEVLLNCSEDPREVLDIRASEARLKAQVDSLQSRLNGPEHRAALEASKQSEVKAKQEADALRKENDGLRLQISKLARQASELQGELTSAKETSAAYVQEIEVISDAFEDLQKQNQRLLQQLVERDEVSNQLVTERIKSGHAAAAHKQEQAAAAAARQRAEQSAAMLQERVNDLQAKLQVSIDEAAALRERSQGLAVQVEGAAREAREATEALRSREAALEAAQRLAAEKKRAADEEADRLARERVKRQRLEEDVKVANSKVERMRRAGGGGGDAEELEAMRTLLRCNVCHERQKDVIITKCWHIFCSHCIRKNLETRNRKCPGCGAAFGQHDVKQFFFT